MASLFSACLLLVNPYATKNFIDEISTGHTERFIYYVIVLFLLFVLSQLSEFFSDLLRGKSEKEVWGKIITTSRNCYCIYDPREKTESRENVNQQLGQSYELIKDFSAYYSVQLVTNFIQEIGIICILFFVSPLNAVLVLLFVPFFILISNRYGDKLAKYGELTVSSMGKCRNFISDLVELSFVERFRKHSLLKPIENILTEYNEHKMKQVKAEAIFSNFLSYAFLNFMIVLSLVISGIQVLKGQITLGSLYAIQLYVSRFWSPVELFVCFYKDFASSKNIIAEFINFFSKDTIDYTESPISSIELKNYISLDAQGNSLHRPVNHVFMSNKINVIVGDNGIGKTSLVLSMLGLSERHSGEIIFPDFPQNKSFVYSPATPLYSEFYNIPVAHGSSMGQLKIAQLERDFTEDKSVYIFDEPTNFLDQEKKGYVREQLENLCRKGKIVILVTHDKDMIRDEDDLIVLEPK